MVPTGPVDAPVPMPLDTPILRVSRPVAACSRCRVAKIKCDGKLPACTSCERNGRAAECTSTNEEFARGKERSYVATLETRLEKLQARLDEVRQRKPSVVSVADDETVVPSRPSSQHRQHPQHQHPQQQTRQQHQPASEGESPSPMALRKMRRNERSAIDELVSDFGFLTVNATARDFYGFTQAMSYARLILWSCTKDDLPRKITPNLLPPRHEANRLTQHYFENVLALLPIFEQATFYASVDRIYSPKPNVAEPFDHWSVHMVWAIANASKSQRRHDSHHQEAVAHVCTALERAEEVLHPGSIQSIQALVLLTEYAMLDPRHFDSWNLIGAASRAMVDLGLHQDPIKGTVMPKAKLELRRKVFHCVYALDRSTSMVQTRAFSFSDDSANVKLPFSRAQSAPTSPSHTNGGLQQSWLSTHDRALDYVLMRQIQSRWYTDLFQSGGSVRDDPYPYIWDACEKMRRWFANLSSATNPSMRCFFELDLLYSYVYILSPSPHVPVAAPYTQTLVFEHCIRYSDLLLRLVGDPSHTAPLTFFDAMRAYMTGRQFADALAANMDMLLNRRVVAPPPGNPTGASAPSLPSIGPGETILRTNIIRAINCLQRTSECLTRLGTRFGFTSWQQRFDHETAAVSAELNRRWREIDEAAVSLRRPSIRQHGSDHSASTGSFSSNHAMVYQQAQHDSVSGTLLESPGAYNQMPVFSPGIQPMQPQPQPPSQQPVQVQQAQNAFTSQMFGHFPIEMQAFSIPPELIQPRVNPQQLQQSAFQPAPANQFANWGGYSGPRVAETVDENAVPPHANWHSPI